MNRSEFWLVRVVAGLIPFQAKLESRCELVILDCLLKKKKKSLLIHLHFAVSKLHSCGLNNFVQFNKKAVTVLIYRWFSDIVLE